MKTSERQCVISEVLREQMPCESEENYVYGRGAEKEGGDSGVQSGWPLFHTRYLERSWMLQVGASLERVFNNRVLWSGFYSEGGRSPDGRTAKARLSPGSSKKT